MITEGEAAILLETTRRALGNQSQSKQRSTLVYIKHGVGLMQIQWSTTFTKSSFLLKKLTLVILFQMNGGQ